MQPKYKASMILDNRYKSPLDHKRRIQMFKLEDFGCFPGEEEAKQYNKIERCDDSDVWFDIRVKVKGV